MKLAFFGGTFDPPHKGHEMIIEHCSILFDQLLIVPNCISPDKKNNPPVSKDHRLNMLKIIVNKNSNNNIKIDTFELDSKRDNYTYLTIKYLIKNYTFSKLYMVIGDDQLSNLANWYNIKFILDNVNIVCFNRFSNMKVKDNIYNNIKYIPFDYPISSSLIREKIRKNIELNYETISGEVHTYIEDNNLYK